MCILSEKGPDNKPVLVTSVSNLIKTFGTPSIRKYAQAWYVAKEYLETLNNLWVMRVLPKNASYASFGLKLTDSPTDDIAVYKVVKKKNESKETITEISNNSTDDKIVSIQDLNANTLEDILNGITEGGVIHLPVAEINRAVIFDNEVSILGARSGEPATDEPRENGETILSGVIVGNTSVTLNGLTLTEYALSNTYTDIEEFDISNCRFIDLVGGDATIPESYYANEEVADPDAEEVADKTIEKKYFKTVDERYYSFINVTDLGEINTVPSINSLLTGVNKKADIVFYPYGRGEYYNCLGIKLTKAKKSYPNAFILDIYEKPKDSTYPNLVESFEVSFDIDAKDISGTSLFIKDVLDMYSDYIRCEVSDMISKYEENEEYKDEEGNVFIVEQNYDNFAMTDIEYFTGGSDGTMYDKNGNLNWDVEVPVDESGKTENMVMALSNAYLGLNINPETGEYNEEITDTENMDFTVVFDAGWPTPVKDAIVDLCDSRQSCFGFLDNGVASTNGNRSAQEAIDKRLSDHNYNDYRVALYEPYTKMYDSFTGTYYWSTPIVHAVSCFSRTARDFNVWWAFAGLNRGNCSGIRDYRYKLAGGYRDMFKQEEINPIVRFNQGGDCIWGNWSATCSAMKSCSNF